MVILISVKVAIQINAYIMSMEIFNLAILKVIGIVQCGILKMLKMDILISVINGNNQNTFTLNMVPLLLAK